MVRRTSVSDVSLGTACEDTITCRDMGTVVFLNGAFFGTSDVGDPLPPLADARVSCFDAGLQHAVGLFETMIGGVHRQGVEGSRSQGESIETWVIQLDEHLQRLDESARNLGLSDQLRIGALGQAVVETVSRSGLARARVRLTISGGDLSMLAAARGAAAGGSGGQPRQVDPTVLIVAQPATEYPASMYEQGVNITLCDARANPLGGGEGHKTLNYWWRLRELQQASAKGAGEGLVLSVTNHVCGGCVSNILLVKGDSLLTPIARGEELEVAGSKATVLPSPVLPGVTRRWALDRADRLGLKARRQMLSLQDVLEADEVILTNSSWGVLPVRQVEGREIGSGTPGPIAAKLRAEWLALLPGAVADDGL